MLVLIFLILIFIFLILLANKVKYPRKILFAPFFIFCFAWINVFFLYVSHDEFLDVETIFIIITFLISFIVPGLFVVINMRGKLNTNIDFIYYEKDKNIKKLIYILLTCQLVSIAGIIIYVISIIEYADLPTLLILAGGGHISGGSYAGMDGMDALRRILATSDYRVPIWIKLLTAFRYSNNIAPIVLLGLYMSGRIKKSYVIISFLFALIAPVILLERMGVIRLVFTSFIVYCYFSKDIFYAIKKGFIVSLIVLLPVIIIVPVIRGQGDEGGSNAYNYLVGALAGLNAFVVGTNGTIDGLELDQKLFITKQGYNFGDAPIGMESLTEIYRICNAIGLSEIYIPKNKEYIDKPMSTNIYTGVRSFYQDFGVIGMPLTVVLFSLFLHSLYILSLLRKGFFSIYIISYASFVSASMIFVNNFYLRDIVFIAVFCYIVSFISNISNSFWFGESRKHANV